jgi:hypothetical protein
MPVQSAFSAQASGGFNRNDVKERESGRSAQNQTRRGADAGTLAGPDARSLSANQAARTAYGFLA